MKHLLFAALIAFPLFANAQSGMKGMDMKDMDHMKGMKPEAKADAKVHHGKGTVSKVDARAGAVTINHEPVPTMNWSAMSMAFKVKDKKMLDKVKQGDKVEFTFTQSGKDHVISEMK